MDLSTVNAVHALGQDNTDLASRYYSVPAMNRGKVIEECILGYQVRFLCRGTGEQA